MLPIKLVWNVYVTCVWQIRSKSVTNSCEYFTRYEEFGRIIHTCEKYEVWILRFNIAAHITNDTWKDPTKTISKERDNVPLLGSCWCETRINQTTISEITLFRFSITPKPFKLMHLHISMAISFRGKKPFFSWFSTLMPGQGLFKPRHEKTCLWGLRPVKTQTSLLSSRD